MAIRVRIVWLVAVGYVLLAVGMTQTLLAQQALGWERYENDSFDFSLSVPRGLLANRVEGGPEQVTLSSEDGKVVVNIFGAENSDHRPLREVVADYRRHLPDARITYEWFGRNSAVLSGYQNGDILYVRLAMSADRSRVAVLNMLYARDLKRTLDPVVTRLSRSLAFR